MLNIYKEEQVLGGLSIDYSDMLAISKDAEVVADEIGLNPNRELFENNAQYFRTALVAYNAVFDDLGDLSKKEYVIKIVQDAVQGGKRKECPHEL